MSIYFSSTFLTNWQLFYPFLSSRVLPVLQPNWLLLQWYCVFCPWRLLRRTCSAKCLWSKRDWVTAALGMRGVNDKKFQFDIEAKSLHFKHLIGIQSQSYHASRFGIKMLSSKPLQFQVLLSQSSRIKAYIAVQH